jgi:transcriptional regulator with XRE-family HTH domain
MRAKPRLAENLKRLRGQLSQKELEKLSGVPSRVIQRIEYGETDQGTTELIALAEVFNVSLDELVGYNIEATPQRAIAILQAFIAQETPNKRPVIPEIPPPDYSKMPGKELGKLVLKGLIDRLVLTIDDGSVDYTKVYDFLTSLGLEASDDPVLFTPPNAVKK